ncbi:PAS domain S-box-containing protein/diguanylate cyclase (GGDEF) domain-containing protein [Blastococcus aurantiacus]|uniref:PAS domain S-box-containing protein/diguanylate cyclase (GGDEF) domain-containing protein n=1 Tax=Blastococcus aurantiacus TaxID=1550231 RepID=A0A1G7MUZ9_9ACTN|nr:diguanylate cyclase [Blastococcus aurantiacus]SDF65593.1 PAS domain S-box-containing protein/diguanylate cyclase (GGDEF) domain-containing protein [Blastococcus aurantiacus]
MSAVGRRLVWTLVLGLLGLALAVPFSAPDGTGMQWDELVLGCVAVSSGWTAYSRIRLMDRAAARPWWPTVIGAACFAVAQFLAGSFPGPAFDGFGVDDVILFAGATSPLVTCALLARRVIRTRWSALVVDGLLTTTALLVITEVLRTSLVDPAGAPEDLRPLVLAYGGYTAVMLGGAGALCTVSTRALRRSATTMIAVVAAQAGASACEAMAIVAPSPLWTAGSDVAVALALVLCPLAAHLAPQRFADRSARASAPVVGATGMALVVVAMAGLPLALALAVAAGEPLSVATEFGCGAVFTLMALRMLVRIREDGRMTEDLVRSEEDFRELVEASSDGIAIMDDEYRLLFTSPAARTLLGIDGRDEEVTLLQVVRPEDRAALRAATEESPAGSGPPLHLGVVGADGEPRELEATSSERPGSGRRVLYLRDVTTRRRRERELERMAYTDHLTRLPNRAVLFQELGATTAAERCLLVLDMDGFKAVNDGAGHEAGDQLLVEVARRLNTVVRDTDLVARLGGDEFAVVLTGGLSEAEDVAARIVQVMAMPHRVDGAVYAVGASVGIAVLGPGGGQLAFREADAALRSAKAAGKGCVRVAREDSSDAAPTHDFYDRRAEGAMRLRLDGAFGPDGHLELVHALPVWGHAELGVLDGPDIWAASERHGRSSDLQQWLIHEACAAAAGLADSRLGVVVSLPAGHVTVAGLAEQVATEVADSGLDPARLVVSFTEETLLTAPAALVGELEAIRSTGVRLCLDDYGMGYSLYALLARISLDLVRIDLPRLAGHEDAGRAMQVLAAIVRTTEHFGIDVIAGGIGTPELQGAAVATGVQLLQGRALPHDLALDDVVSLLAPA